MATSPPTRLARPVRNLCGAVTLGIGALLVAAPVASAQQDTTSTTQLDLGSGDETTPTTALELESAPTRVDAGAGGAARAGQAAPTPTAAAALAGGAIAAVGASALRVRRHLSAS
jgi:hypothetical protein